MTQEQSESVAIPLAPLAAAAHSPSFLQQEQTYTVATAQLRLLGYDLKEVYAQHAQRVNAFESAQPTALDVKWATRLATQPCLQEHFEAQLLGAARCFKGRQYTLSPGQRALLRQRHGLTPTREVIITDVALFANSEVIRSFAIKSTAVVADRRHLLEAAVICPAGEFFCEAERLDHNSQTAKELEAFIVRVERLYLRAKVEQSILPRQGNSAGAVGSELQALCETEKILDQKLIREQLRCILLRRGELQLAGLVKEPRYFPDRDEAKGPQLSPLAVAAQYI